MKCIDYSQQKNEAADTFYLWFKRSDCFRQSSWICFYQRKKNNKVNSSDSKWQIIQLQHLHLTWMELCTCRRGSMWILYDWIQRQYSVSWLVFPLPAILRLDHSVVDLETIEALYENVRDGTAGECYKADRATANNHDTLSHLIVSECSQTSWRESRSITRRHRRKTWSCWTNLNSQYQIFTFRLQKLQHDKMQETLQAYY